MFFKKRSKTIRIEPAKNSKQNQNPHPIWERESEWEKERESTITTTPNHHAIAADLQTTMLSPPIFSPYCWFLSPIHANLRDPQQKFKANQNPYLMWERIEVKEREDRNERERESTIVAAPNHHTITADLQSSCSDTTVASFDGFSLGFAFTGENLFLLFLFFFFFWLNSFFFNTTQVYTIKKI